MSTLGNRAAAAFYAGLQEPPGADENPGPDAMPGPVMSPETAVTPETSTRGAPKAAADPDVAAALATDPKAKAKLPADPELHAVRSAPVQDWPEPNGSAPTPSEPEPDVSSPGTPDVAAAEAAPEPDLPPVPSPETTAPGPGFAAWRSRTMAAARAIQVPLPPAAATVSAGVKAQSGQLANGRAGRRAIVTADADAAVTAPPKPAPPPVAPPPEPVPAASAQVEAKAGRTISDAVMPDLVPSPRGTATLVRDPAARLPDPPVSSQKPEQSTEPATQSTPDTAAPEIDACIDDVQQSIAAPVPELPPGTAIGATLTDTPPPPREPLPPLGTAIMKDVIARLLVNPAEQAAPILAAARDEAYPNGVLARVYPDIGSDKLTGVTEALASQLRLIATDAGITAADMDAAVSKRRDALLKSADETHGALHEGRKDGEGALSKSGKDEAGEVDAAAAGRDAKTHGIVAASAGADSPAVIDLRRDQQIGRLNRRVGQTKFDYEQAKLRRHAALDRAQRLQEMAYDATSRDDQAAIDRAATPGSVMLDNMAKGGVRNWANEQKRAVATAVRKLREAVTTETTGYRLDATTAGIEAASQVRDWALKEKGETQGFFAQLYQMFLDWSGQAQAEADLWAEQRAGEARDATISNVNTLQSFVASQGEAVDLATNEAFKTLSKEQQEVIRTYYAAPSGSRDALGAVAAGLRFRVGAEERGKLVEKLRDEVMSKPYSEADNLEQIAQAENAGFSATKIADNLYNAMFGGVTGWGTDEGKIFANLGGLSPLAGRAVRATYNQDHGRNLDSDLKSEMGGGELLRAQGALNGDVVTEAVGALHEAMDGLGTDEDTIMKMLRGKSEAERALIKAEYLRRYGVNLDAELKDEMSDHDLDRAEALMDGDTAKADAIAIDQAMHGGILGWGTDEAQIEGVYGGIRNDVAGQQVPGDDGKMRPMTAEEMEAEVARRNADVEASYDTRYGSPGDQDSALRSAYNSELSGPDLDLANALADNDLIAADAARLEREKQGILYADDAVINGVLENQYARALDGLKRDPKWRGERDALQEKARKEGWDPYRLANAERDLDRRMEEAAREGGAANMAKLESAYDTKYSRWGKGGLDAMIVFNMSGTDREKAQALRQQGGYLSRAQRVDFATRGPGTDEEDFKRATEGMTKAEIADLNRDLAKLGRPSVDKIAADELDGREGFDMKVTLRGVPENIDEDMAQARMRTSWELANSPITGHERDVMENRLAKMRRQYDLIRDPNAPRADRDRALAQFRARGVGVQLAVEQYRAQVDAVTDAVATAAALTVAIVVTVATGGIAGAVLGALYAAMTTIAVKTALKGAAYGTDEMAVDAVVGIVDAAAAAATAGVGNALLRVAMAQGGKRARGLASTKLAMALAKMAQSTSRTQRMLAHGIAEGVEGAAGALPSALAGNMLNDKNWQGNPLANIVGGTLMETGFGFALGGGLGSLGGIKMPKPDVLPTPRGSMDLLVNRGTPQDRLSAWKAHKAENPDARMGDFLQSWDKAATERLAKQADDATLQAAMRSELMAGLPPADRRALAGFKVEILSEADFRKFTRSDSAQAVTIIDNGTPKVLFRDGAPLSVLREEGIHLHQIADPDLGPLARRLDEARLGKWDRLSLAEKMELYAIKVDLEIDAQKKLIASLQADIKAGRAGDLAGLSKQIADSELALANLEKRAAEVAGMGRLDRIAMARGLRDPPPWLDQPARLFNKGRTPAAKKPKVLKNSSFPDTSGFKGRALQAREIPRPAGTPSKRFSDVDLHPKAEFTVNIKGKGPTRFKVIKGELKMRRGSSWVDTPDGIIRDADRKVPPFIQKGGQKVRIERPYRDVALVDPANPSVILALREEAYAVSGRTLQFSGKWVESGTSISRRGQAAEALSRELSAQNVANPDSPVIATLQVQRANGTGFDGIEIRLQADGTPVITVIEVKDYSGYVNYKEFTAVTSRKGNPPGNLLENLRDLRNKLTPTDAERAAARLAALEKSGGPLKMMGAGGAANAHVIAFEADMALAEIMGKKLGLTVETYRLAQKAMATGNIELLIRLTPHSLVGRRGSAAVLMKKLKADWKGVKAREFIKVIREIRVDPILPHAIRDATAAARALGVDLRYTKLPEAPFSDGRGNLFAVEQAANLTDPAKIDQFADRLAQKLASAVMLPNGTHRELGLVIDLSDHQGDKSALEQAILKALEAALLRRAKPTLASKRVTFLAQRR